jgi:hypothetical protein
MNKQEKVERCLGPGKVALFIPQFIFTASACKHDELFEKANNIIEKIMADVFFYAYMLEDIVKGNYKFRYQYFYFTMATLYLFTALSLGTLYWILFKIKRRLCD